MNRRVFVDAAVILDLLCRREPFYSHSAAVFSLGDEGEIDLATTSLVFANAYYILRKILGIEKAKELFRKLRLMVGVVPVGEKAVDLALNSRFADFEDGLQYFTTRESGIAILLTRNTKDYRERDLVVQTPEGYMKARA